MPRTDTIIIGAGQAGLAMSRHLVERGHDHIIFERGRIGERWRSQRWDSLRLLTPNWMNRLPGYAYRGDDEDGYLARGEVVDYLDGYATSFGAPVREETTVLSATPRSEGWEVVTDQGSWRSRQVVIATGACDRPYVPSVAQGLADDLFQIATTTYRNPEQLPPGGVLVVGASASGVQLADELRRSGREVVIAVGRHTRLPRLYRGRDILWWLDRMGTLDRRISDMSDPDAARQEPSLQLVGRRTRESVDLGILAARGVRLAGRLVGAEEHRVRFADDLPRTTAEADLKLVRLTDRIDRYIAEAGLESTVPPADPIAPVQVREVPSELDLGAAGIRTVLWATGFRRAYPWLHASVLDRHGEIVQAGGRTPARGLYVLGLPFMIRRKSTFIGGVGDDARDLADVIAPQPAPSQVIAA